MKIQNAIKQQIKLKKLIGEHQMLTALLRNMEMNYIQNRMEMDTNYIKNVGKRIESIEAQLSRMLIEPDAKIEQSVLEDFLQALTEAANWRGLKITEDIRIKQDKEICKIANQFMYILKTV